MRYRSASKAVGLAAQGREDLVGETARARAGLQQRPRRRSAQRLPGVPQPAREQKAEQRVRLR